MAGNKHKSRNKKSKLEPHLKRHVSRAATSDKGAAKGKVRIVVQFRGKLCRKHFELLHKAIGKRHVRGGTPLHLIRSVAAEVPIRRIHALDKCHAVKRVYLDRKRRISLNYATPSVGAAAAQKAGLTGKGVTIAVVDTGVYRHPDLTRPVNRIVAFKDFVNGRKSPYDDNGHGTHCAGDAAGNGRSSSGKYKGPAPGAKIVGVKVMDASGDGYDSTIIQGLQWCITNKRRYGIRIMSLSLGSEATVPYRKDPLCQAVGKVRRSGITVFAAAGNSGPGRGTIESPGISPDVITVGASDDHHSVQPSKTTIAGFSSRGPAKGGLTKPDIVAPGVGIVSLRAPRSTLDRQMPGNRVGARYFRLSGTSMATPVAAGAAALLLQREPGLSPGRIKARLKREALNLGRGAYAQGSGLENVRFLGGSAAGSAAQPRGRRAAAAKPWTPHGGVAFTLSRRSGSRSGKRR